MLEAKPKPTPPIPPILFLSSLLVRSIFHEPPFLENGPFRHSFALSILTTCTLSPLVGARRLSRVCA